MHDLRWTRWMSLFSFLVYFSWICKKLIYKYFGLMYWTRRKEFQLFFACHLHNHVSLLSTLMRFAYFLVRMTGSLKTDRRKTDFISKLANVYEFSNEPSKIAEKIDNNYQIIFLIPSKSWRCTTFDIQLGT